MDVARLSRSPIGSCVPILAPDPVSGVTIEGRAFLPAPLPQTVELTSATWSAVAAATAALARLDGAARLIPSPGLLRRPAIRREAQSTSALEGTFAPFETVLAADAEDRDDFSSELREILNFERMAELAFSWPEERPLTLTMLGELQRTLVSGTPGEMSDSGGLRDRVVVVGSPGGGLGHARFVPPPPGDQLRSGMTSLLRWIDDPPTLPIVVQAAMAHYQFETLHPYSDGNGRLGRLLVIVQLMRGARIREPLLVVSPWFEQRRAQYQDALLELSCDGDWDAWVAFFTAGVESAAVTSQAKVEALLELREQLRARVLAAGRRGAAERVAEDLVGMPFVSRASIAAVYDLSGQGAKNIIDALVDLGILVASEQRTRRGRLFRAPEVLDILAR